MVGSALLNILGDVLFRTRTQIGTCAGYIVFIAAAFGWMNVLKHEELAKAIVLLCIINGLGCVIAGVGFFHEKLSTSNIVGIVFGLISMVLMSL